MTSFFSSSKVVRILAPAVVLALLAGGVVSAPAPPAPKGDSGDLALVPADAQGVVTVRVADLHKLDVVRKALAAIAKQPGAEKVDFTAELRKATSLAPADIERCTAVIVDMKEQVAYVLVATVKPYDRAKVLEKLSGAKAVKHNGRTYYLGKTEGSPTEVGLYFASPRVLVYAPEKGLKACLTNLGARKNKGPLDDALKLAAGKHHLVAGINPSSGGLREFRDELGKQWKGFNSLLDLKSATIAMDFGPATQFELTARYPDARKANDARKVAEGVKAAIELLAMPAIADAVKQMLPPQHAKDVIDGLARALDSYKVEQKDTLVSVKFKIENKVFEGLFAGAAMLR
jgi:hypothetical protein